MKGKELLLGVSLSLIVALGVPPSVYAAGDGPTGDTVGSNDPDKDKPGATDVYLLACPSGTRTARAKINEGNNEDVQLSVLVVNPHGSATTESGVNGGGSDEAILRGGPGSYLVLVHKSAAGPNPAAGLEGYTITLDCYDAQGVRFEGDQSTLVQDQ
jgi:hypothetical protein